MQKVNLKSYAINLNISKGRFYAESKNKIRSPFQRDRDRIIHSSAFRRLKHKTQVFVNTTGDHYRTRLTHSMEVSQIARTIARALNLNEDLCEALSLAHDLGHTPFGHAGEEVLNKCMIRYGGFDHNIQTLRIVLFLENKYYKFNGLNLTFETLDGLIKHNGPVNDSKKMIKILGKNFLEKKIIFKNNSSLEAQVASISDDIAYNSHDLEDGFRANMFNLKDLSLLPFLKNIVNKHFKFRKYYRKEIIINQIVRDLINLFVIDIIENTKRNIKKYKIKNIADVYKIKEHNIVEFSAEKKELDASIKKFLKKNMYLNSKVLKNTKKGKQIINELFYYILNKPDTFIKSLNLKKDFNQRHVSDFIAGMTDRYAINLFEKIK